MPRQVHPVHHAPDPIAGPPSRARVSAAVSRIQSAHAGASGLLGDLFGYAVVEALSRRVVALSVPGDAPERAERVLRLVMAIAAVVELIEREDDDAREIGAILAGIEADCRLITSSRVESLAA